MLCMRQLCVELALVLSVAGQTVADPCKATENQALVLELYKGRVNYEKFSLDDRGIGDAHPDLSSALLADLWGASSQVANMVGLSAPNMLLHFVW